MKNRKDLIIRLGKWIKSRKKKKINTLNCFKEETYDFMDLTNNPCEYINLEETFLTSLFEYLDIYELSNTDNGRVLLENTDEIISSMEEMENYNNPENLNTGNLNWTLKEKELIDLDAIIEDFLSVGANVFEFTYYVSESDLIVNA